MPSFINDVHAGVGYVAIVVVIKAASIMTTIALVKACSTHAVGDSLMFGIMVVQDANIKSEHDRH